MKLKSYTLAALVMVILFGGILLSTAMNWWQTESTKSPDRYTSGDAAGQYDPADIRGSYTFGEISDLFAIPLEDLAAAFRLPADVDAASFTVKDLEAIVTGLPVEVGTSSVRLFTAFYNGLPYDLAASEETYLFPEAAEILTAHNKMLPEQAEYLLTHIVTADLVPPTPDETTVVTTESAEVEKKVSGSTTFQYLLDWGLSQEIIETVIGEPMPDPTLLIKDFATQNGLEFSTVKNALQAEVDKLP